MEKKKSIWNYNPLRPILGYGKFGGNFFWKFSRTKFSSGFTLIELLVAIAIIGVLAGSAFFALNPAGQFAKSHDAQRKNDLEQIRNALDAYYSDNSRYPTTINATVLSDYIQKIPTDPLGVNYTYEASADGSSYRLYANLERCSDSQGTVGVDCLRTDKGNYSINSSNLAALALLPTPTPAPPTSTPTPTPKPAQTPIKTKYPTFSTSVSTSDKSTMGYRFKADVNGRITALWDYSRGGTKTLKLWSDAGAVLNSVTVTGDNAWVQGILATPTSITAGTYYRVTTYIPQYGYYLGSFSVPTTMGAIRIEGICSITGDGFPTCRVTSTLRGIPDITFIPD